VGNSARKPVPAACVSTCTGYFALTFSDDTLMFMEIKEQQAMVIHRVLRQYELGTGQLINPAKCSIMFGKNCEGDKEKIKEILGVAHVVEDEKYLGLPTPHGRMSKDRFKSTKERLAKRLTTWDERFMWVGAKEVLIKSVAKAIPTYVMDVFKLLSTLCEEMTRMIRYFWWGEEGGQRKIHWTAWERLLLPKCYGGIGFCYMLSVQPSFTGSAGVAPHTTFHKFVCSNSKGQVFS
jgi:hypothetical protein